MSRYLDPKTDIVFKKIFGYHPQLLKSFLNAILPLSPDALIESLEYLSNEQVPEIPAFKYTVVDVKCRDTQGRHFIVEMQIQWTTGFMQRMLFNASTAYVRQLKSGEQYRLLQPVYGLALLASTFDQDSSDWYHHYTLVNLEKPERTIKDLQLIFVELPKFQPSSISQKKLQVLWLRFMSELNQETRTVPEEWLKIPEIKEAVALSEAAAYSLGELEAYDKYWDAIRTEKTLISGFYDQGKTDGLEIGRTEGRAEGRAEGLAMGHAEGLAMGHAEGLAAGRAEGELKSKYQMIQTMLTMGMTFDKISSITGLSLFAIQTIASSNIEEFS